MATDLGMVLERSESSLRAPLLEGDAALGAAAVLNYLQSLLLVSGREAFGKAELVHTLRQVRSDVIPE